jgi:hypothetical protein
VVFQGVGLGPDLFPEARELYPHLDWNSFPILALVSISRRTVSKLDSSEVNSSKSRFRKGEIKNNKDLKAHLNPNNLIHVIHRFT